MPEAQYLRQYFADVKDAVLLEHPDWDAETGGECE